MSIQNKTIIMHSATFNKAMRNQTDIYFNVIERAIILGSELQPLSFQFMLRYVFICLFIFIRKASMQLLCGYQSVTSAKRVHVCLNQGSNLIFLH